MRKLTKSEINILYSINPNLVKFMILKATDYSKHGRITNILLKDLVKFKNALKIDNLTKIFFRLDTFHCSIDQQTKNITTNDNSANYKINDKKDIVLNKSLKISLIGDRIVNKLINNSCLVPVPETVLKFLFFKFSEFTDTLFIKDSVEKKNFD